MIAGEVVAAALELLGHALELLPTKRPQVPVDQSLLPLTPRQRELVAAIQQQRRVSLEVAEDLVRWLATQDPRFNI